MEAYKYYSGLTSQLSFCATPLRLDSYSRCQFSCEYCFAATRQGFGRQGKLKISSPKALLSRLNRVSEGNIASALDELIYRRVPFQLGGMSDPFMKIEDDKKITLEFLKVLKKHDYPVIISTKGISISNDDYLDYLTGGNVYVRFSTTIVNEINRYDVDKGCPSIQSIAQAARKLSDLNIPVSFRFQPIIPGHESSYEKILDLAHSSGVKHISAEYLKCPIDANKKFGKSLKALLNNDPIGFYQNLNATKVGREYLLPLSYRASYLKQMAGSARSLGMTFGFADNDLLIHSDGDSCCSASNLYLRDAGFFSANIVSLAKRKKIDEEIFFEDFLAGWMPKEKISTYLNSKSRIIVNDQSTPEWANYLLEMWKGNLGVFTPDYFDGVERSSGIDDSGLPIYVRKSTWFESYIDN